MARLYFLDESKLDHEDQESIVLPPMKKKTRKRKQPQRQKADLNIRQVKVGRKAAFDESTRGTKFEIVSDCAAKALLGIENLSPSQVFQRPLSSSQPVSGYSYF